MIDLYTWTTPNGRKVSILLEELGVPYEVHAVDLENREQHLPGFEKISPNRRIPAIVDRDTGFTLMESGAILLYLGKKYDRFLCRGEEYWRMMEWLMWQMGGLGPMLGQVHHFVHYNPGLSEYAEKRYSREAHRLYATLDARLEGRDFMVGVGRGEYSITDMATWPWISRHDRQRIDLNDYPNVRDWYVRLAERPAVQAGYHVPKRVNDIPMP